MPRVHQVAAGTMGIPMPALRQGDVDRKTPGGYPPAQPRNVFRSLVGHHSRKRNTREQHTSAKWYEIERALKTGQLTYDRPM